MRLLAATRVFSKRLSKCIRPCCAACFYGSAQRKPRKTKGNHDGSVLQNTKKNPGEIDHVDLLTSSVTELIPQMVGFLASKKFHCTTFFVENRSDCTFSYHQEKLTLNKQ